MNVRMTVCLFMTVLFLFSGCQAAPKSTPEATPASEPVSSFAAPQITDSEGTLFTLPENPKVVALYSSYAEAWLLAGGNLCGVTEDALEERDLDLPKDTALVGTVKEPNAEAIVALEPDLVLLSLDISNQVKLKEALSSAGIACAYFRVDTFSDYKQMMTTFCGFTGRQDLFEQHVLRAEEQIDKVKTAALASDYIPSVLLLRAFSTGIKAKSREELAGDILADLGCRNLADETPSMLEDLSLEQVILANPDYIFITTMGDEEKALAYFDALTRENPAWSTLSAVQNKRCIVLPKNLFHYKPNSRWGDSYEYLGDILYPALMQPN